jgi:hypothetical protein
LHPENPDSTASEKHIPGTYVNLEPKNLVNGMLLRPANLLA